MAKRHRTARPAGRARRRRNRLVDEALAFVRLLASYECAGSPACEPPLVDAATGRLEGEMCGPCSAREWLDLMEPRPRLERLAPIEPPVMGYALHHWPECRGGDACRCGDGPDMIRTFIRTAPQERK